MDNVEIKMNLLKNNQKTEYITKYFSDDDF